LRNLALPGFGKLAARLFELRTQLDDGRARQLDHLPELCIGQRHLLLRSLAANLGFYKLQLPAGQHVWSAPQR
jgi:hypothetical protein